MLRRDPVEPLDGHRLDDHVPTTRLEIRHPAVRLEPDVDRLEVGAAEPAGEREEDVVLGRTERQVHASPSGGQVLPVVQSELAFVLQGRVETRCRPGGTTLVQPVLGRAVGVEGDIVPSLAQPVAREEPGDAGAHDRNLPHAVAPPERSAGRYAM